MFGSSLERIVAFTAGAAVAAALVYVRARRRTGRPAGLVRVTYWAGRGRCEPLRCILAAGGLEFEQVFLTEATGKAELTKLRDAGKLGFDQLPLVEIDGLSLVQQTPTANYLAARLDLLPADFKASYDAQGIYASSQDARGPLMSYPFKELPNPPGDKARELVRAEVHGPKGLFGRYAPKWEAILSSSSGPFFLGGKPSIADVGAFEVLDFYAEIFGDDALRAALVRFPRVQTMLDATKALGRLADHCDVERTRYATWDAATKTHCKWLGYAMAVRTTLS